MKIIVTGGAGFIGSHLVENVLQKGHRVVVVDNESTGKRTNVPFEAAYYQMDICDQAIMDVFAKEQPEVVVHLAAQSVVPASIDTPIYDAEMNIKGLLHILEASRLSGVRKVIFSSTAAVYGEQTTFPIREEQAGLLLSPYAVSKYAGENYLAVYQHLYGLDYTVFRLANVYGPRQVAKADGGVVALFIDFLRQNKTITINGDGEQTRDFVYVEDVAEAMTLAFTKADNTVMNISTCSPTSINVLYEELSRISPCPLKRVFGPARPGDIRHCYLSNERMKQLLDWEPRYTIDAGLQHTLHAQVKPSSTRKERELYAISI